MPELVVLGEIRFKNLLKCRDPYVLNHSFYIFFRNFRQNGVGNVEEIGFEEFLLVMSHFRPPSLHMMAEQREDVRRDKLRCVCLQITRSHA